MSAGEVVLAERYARALLDVVVDKKGDLDRVGRELAEMQELLDENPRLAEVLTLPTIPTDKRAKVLGEVLSSEDLDQSTRNTLRILTTNDRMSILPLVVEQFRRLALEHRKIQPGEVTTAYPLTDEQQKRLSDSLGAAVGKTMELSYKTDPTLIGGLVVRVGNQVFDASVVTQLERFKDKALSSL